MFYMCIFMRIFGLLRTILGANSIFNESEPYKATASEVGCSEKCILSGLPY